MRAHGRSQLEIEEREGEAGARRLPSMSDVVGLQRREAVEGHRRVGRRVGAGALDQHLVADLQAHRQRVRLLLVQHVGRVAGRAGQHARAHGVGVPRRADRVADRLVHGLGQAAELADIEIDPAHVVFLALLGDEHDLAFDHAGIADHAAARLDDGLRDAVAEVLAQRLEDRRAVGFHRRHVLQVLGREAAAQIDHVERHAALAALLEHRRRRSERGMALNMVNLGGGFPTKYLKNVPSVKTYGTAIFKALRKHFGNRIPETIIEPGRGMVGNAGVIESEVVLVSKKSEEDDVRWVYLDIGKFGGLAETMDESIRYPIRTTRDADTMGPCVLAGPTCDSADVLYEKQPYPLPVSLEIGDKVLIEGTGAYTATYSSVAFNGFAPLKTYHI